MSELRADCRRFAEWLADGAAALDGSAWAGHLETCRDCRRQWHAHRLLATAFASKAVPEMSAGFAGAVEARLRATVEVRPLEGWRRGAMLAYGAGAAAVLGWALGAASLSAIDPAATWVSVAAFVAVPWTFLLAIALSRWIPGPAFRTSAAG